MAFRLAAAAISVLLAGPAAAAPRPLTVSLRIRVAECAGAQGQQGQKEQNEQKVPVRPPDWVAEHVQAVQSLLAPHAITISARTDSFAPPSCEVLDRHARDSFADAVDDDGAVTVLVVGRVRDLDVPSYDLRGVHWYARNRQHLGRDWIFLTELARPPVLAHELGHYFGLPHDPAGGNLMTPGPSSPAWRSPRPPRPFQAIFTPGQIRRLRAGIEAAQHRRPRAPAPSAEFADLGTVAETTAFERTGRYDEVMALCRVFARRYPRQARCVEFGRSPEGRPMLALVVSRDGKLDPSSARRATRPAIFVVGGIHAGEIDGKDAGLLVVRELLAGQGPAKALGAVTLVFVPVFNVDGHERFGPNQRPNQRGPSETGFRTTAQNLNLNRDWVKADAPEMVAMLGLIAAWDPILLVDLHVTDGAKFEHDVAVMVAPEEPLPHGLDEAALALSQHLMTELGARGHLPVPFYPSFRERGDPATGIEWVPSPPRFSQRYMAARNRLGILVETHSWRAYAHRVKTTRAVLEVLLAEAARQAPAWVQAAAAADRAGEHLGGTEVALTYKATPEARTIDFRGYAFSRRRSEISGGNWIQFDENRPEISAGSILRSRGAQAGATRAARRLPGPGRVRRHRR